jgi:hypothetical protein
MKLIRVYMRVCPERGEFLMGREVRVSSLLPSTIFCLANIWTNGHSSAHETYALKESIAQDVKIDRGQELGHW